MRPGCCWPCCASALLLALLSLLLRAIHVVQLRVQLVQRLESRGLGLVKRSRGVRRSRSLRCRLLSRFGRRLGCLGGFLGHLRGGVARFRFGGFGSGLEFRARLRHLLGGALLPRRF